MPAPGEALERLTQINLEDMITSLGWQGWDPGRWAAGALLRRPADLFARQILQFDQDVADFGLQEGARRILPLFSRGLLVSGSEHLAVHGPLLILSNHPGIADTLALFSTIPRPDLRIVGLERPFLKQLAAVSRQMIYIPEQGEGRLQVLRSMLEGLKSGGAVLTFPAGQIEPDPAVYYGAAESLESWSESIALFIRKVPEVMVVGAVVSHVLAPEAVFHPLTHLRRKEKDRQRLGAAIQLAAHTLFPNLWPLTSEIDFTPPLAGASLAGLHEPAAIRQAVIEHIRPYFTRASHFQMQVYK